MQFKLIRKTLFFIAALLSASVSAQIRLTSNNIEEVLNLMTLEEKAALLVGGGNRIISDNANSMIGSTEALVPGAAGTTTAIPRLEIPSTVLTDGPAGVRIASTRDGDKNTYYATAFPVGIALASTWNTELVENVGKSIGNEVLEYGCDVLLAPGMNIQRNPLGGRNFEYYSEDPVLTGNIAAAYVKGVQSNGVGTSIKHFAGNSQETNRTGVNEVISQRALREIYLKGFEIAVKEARPWTVMSSYNKLNGPLTQENSELLTTILRDEWGFDGIVMTDWIGKRNTMAQILAGNDLMQPGSESQVREIIEKVNGGELNMSDVDKCVRRVLQYVVRTPHFNKYKFSNRPDLDLHAKITRQSAVEGMVLLKNNNNTLPLKNVNTVSLFGITSYNLIAGGTGSGHVYKPYMIDLLTGLKKSGVKVDQLLADLYETYKNFQLKRGENDPQLAQPVMGQSILPEMPVTRNTIDIQAEKKQMAIITLGRQAGEGSDRTIENDFNLSDVERQLITDVCDAFHSRGKKVVVIMNMGAPMETASWKSNPDAILLAWQPGQEGGNSIADVLVGNENPSGKLTVTFPISVIDHPSSADFPIIPKDKKYDPLYRENCNNRNIDYTLHNEGIDVGYRYFNTNNVEVSYPFGYGLSYTKFSYSKPIVKTTKDGFQASITITNTGNVDGKEVVQLYVTAPKSKIEKPSLELKSFAKTQKLQPGESEVLIFTVNNYDLASFDESQSKWVSDKGSYQILFGASSEDIRSKTTYKLASLKEWSVHNVLKPNLQVEQ